jgi:polyisoprenoid-binding protein YceI
MSVATDQRVPTGTWIVDPVHSSAVFAVRHMGIGTFTGRFSKVEAALRDGVLEGRVAVDSVVVPDENLTAHLLSPDFFDTERHPELVFTSDVVRIEGDKLVVEGELTIKGHTERLVAVGTLSGPAEAAADLGIPEKVGIDLAATIDRTAFGLNWNAPLPGGRRMLEDEVTLTVHLELARTEA